MSAISIQPLCWEQAGGGKSKDGNQNCQIPAMGSQLMDWSERGRESGVEGAQGLLA